MCFVLYLCIFTISFNLFLSLDIFGDDKILGLKLNNVEVDLSTIGINLDLQCKPQTVSLNVNVGDLVTLTVYNVHSQITFDASVDINLDSYRCNLDTCSSNSSKPLSTYFDTIDENSIISSLLDNSDSNISPSFISLKIS